MGERECHRADRPFLQAAEEAEVQTTTGVEPWIVAEVAVVAAVVVLCLAYEEAGRAFVLVLVAVAAYAAD